MSGRPLWSRIQTANRSLVCIIPRGYCKGVEERRVALVYAGNLTVVDRWFRIGSGATLTFDVWPSDTLWESQSTSRTRAIHRNVARWSCNLISRGLGKKDENESHE